MRVLLIPCSGRKREGGAVPVSSFVRDLVPPQVWTELTVARAELAAMIGLPAGADLGVAASDATALLPAWQRYDGNLYRSAKLTERDVTLAGARVLIISALYGIIDARDSIRYYNLAMTDPLPGGTTVKRFWRSRHLQRVASAALHAIGAREVHDFLSVAYREAVDEVGRELPPSCEYFPRRYPKLGSGSDHHRGREIRALLASCR